MGDWIGFIAVCILFLFLGAVFIRLGLAIWKKRKMNLIIRYHCDRVSEENQPAFCRLSGIGVFVIGIGLIFSGICTLLTQSVLIFIPMTAGLATGMLLLILAGIRYNH